MPELTGPWLCLGRGACQQLCACPRAGTRAGMPSVLTAPCLATGSPEGSAATTHTAAGPAAGRGAPSRCPAEEPAPGCAGRTAGLRAGSAGAGTGALPLASFPRPAEAGNRPPREPLPAHLPLGRPQTNKYLQTSRKPTNKTRPPAAPARRRPGSPACAAGAAEARLAARSLPFPQGSGCRGRPRTGRGTAARPPSTSHPRYRREKPRAGRAGPYEEEKQISPFLNFHLDYIVLLLWVCPAACAHRFTPLSKASTVKSQRTPSARLLPQGKRERSAGPARPCARPLCRPTALDFITALDVFQLGKRKRRGSLRSTYIHIFSIKTIK